MLKILMRTIILTLITMNVWAQEPSYFFKNPDPDSTDGSANKSTQLFKRVFLDIDLTPKTEGDLGSAPDENTSTFFAVISKDKSIDTIASYSKNKTLENTLLDREFNIYFAVMQLEFKAADNNISRLTFYDSKNVKKGYIIYNWKENKDNKEQVYLESVDLFTYSSTKRDFVRSQTRYFSYGGKAFGKDIKKVNFAKSNQNKYTDEFYGDSQSVVSYIRYGDDGNIQYSKLLKYSGDKLEQVDTYNPYGVLLSSEKKILESGEANEDFSPSREQ